MEAAASLLEDEALRHELVRREPLAERPERGLEDLAGPLVDGRVVVDLVVEGGLDGLLCDRADCVGLKLCLLHQQMALLCPTNTPQMCGSRITQYLKKFTRFVNFYAIERICKRTL